ncbi:hypothetical protein [Clostridium felsineum]|uniref:Uncharacterized protein n=1 Tax=Clostridium felsineum TaxID=36839 RepID=A0A1S8MCD2_9CLOT|nr:hypothetical protein [Clostridium felsineum]URZ04959.1 hypothetical protein CLROS_002830 [Clostridium felsineum]URZ10000.1 hypothetical protein CROST_007080 [Clostridium felsineum]
MTKKRFFSALLALTLSIGISSQIPTLASAKTVNTKAYTNSKNYGAGVVANFSFRRYSPNKIKYNISNPSSQQITVDYTIVPYDSNNKAGTPLDHKVTIDSNDDIDFTYLCPGAVKFCLIYTTTDSNGNSIDSDARMIYV